MAIHFFLGKPGGGKTFRALREIEDELAFGTRVVVTNVSIRLPDFAAYLAEKYPEKDIDLHQRLRVLSEDEARAFYLHRQHGCDFKLPSDGATKDGARVPYVFRSQDNSDPNLPEHRPVMYVIDEVHTFFDARNWMGSGPHVTHYNSQHRKLGDEVFFITQFLELVDKRLRGFSQSFILVRNHKLERVLLFRGPPYHSAKTYQSPPTGMQAVACHEEFFTLDLRLAACYDTTAGMGIQGRNKPNERRVAGLNPLLAIPVFVAVVALLWYLPDLLTAGLVKYGSKVGDAGTAVVNSYTPGPAVPSPVVPTDSTAMQPPSAPVYTPRPVEVYPTGYVARAGRVQVQMSDGSVLYDGHSRLGTVTRHSAWIDGRELAFRPNRNARAAQPAVPFTVPDPGQ